MHSYQVIGHHRTPDHARILSIAHGCVPVDVYVLCESVSAMDKLMLAA